MQTQSRLDGLKSGGLTNLSKDDTTIKKLITDEMLSHYKKGKSRISFFKLLKLAEYYGYNPHQFMTEFVKYMTKDIVKNSFGYVESKIEGGELTDSQYLQMHGRTREQDKKDMDAKLMHVGITQEQYEMLAQEFWKSKDIKK